MPDNLSQQFQIELYRRSVDHALDQLRTELEHKTRSELIDSHLDWAREGVIAFHCIQALKSSRLRLQSLLLVFFVTNLMTLTVLLFSVFG